MKFCPIFSFWIKRDCSSETAALVRHLVPDINKRTLLIIWIISIWTTWVHLFSRKPRKYSFSETSTKQAYNRLINLQQQFHENLMQHFLLQQRINLSFNLELFIYIFKIFSYNGQDQFKPSGIDFFQIICRWLHRDSPMFVCYVRWMNNIVRETLTE